MNDHPEAASPDDTPASSDAEAHTAAERAGSALHDVEAALAHQLDELEELVREHPLATVGIAAGVGLVAGLILGRR